MVNLGLEYLKKHFISTWRLSLSKSFVFAGMLLWIVFYNFSAPMSTIVALIFLLVLFLGYYYNYVLCCHYIFVVYFLLIVYLCSFNVLKIKINNTNNKKRTTDRVQKKCNCITYSNSLVQNLVGAAFAMRCRAIMLRAT